MNIDLVKQTVELIVELIANTEWGQRTTSKKMLQLVYDECCELGTGLSSFDLDNIIEESADINMMLIYFCCKLPDADINLVKRLFVEATLCAEERVENIDQDSYITANVKKIYYGLLKNYRRLTILYETKNRKNELIHNEVKKISCKSIVLALIVNINELHSADSIFVAISKKLQRRYSFYFKDTKREKITEDMWELEKQIEKDIPYIYCNNPDCSGYGLLGGKKIRQVNGTIFCKLCGNKINNSILLPQLTSKERRKVIEVFESNLINSCKGDMLIATLYVFHHLQDCVVLFSDMIFHAYPIRQFLSFFSTKYVISVDDVRHFLHTCFYQTFTFQEITENRRMRSRTVRCYVTKAPKEFLKLSQELGLTENEIRAVLFATITWLKKDYYTKDNWIAEKDRMILDLQNKKHSIFWVFSALYEMIFDEKNRTEIKLIHVHKTQQLRDYEQWIRCLFVNGSYGIQRIVIEYERT